VDGRRKWGNLILRRIRRNFERKWRFDLGLEW